MYFWRISKLKQRLQSDQSTVRSALPYLIANVSIVCLVAGAPNFGYNDPDMWEMGVALLHWTVQAIIAAVGIRISFRANGVDGGLQFLERLNALGFVLFVRFVVVFALVAGALFFTNFGRAVLAPAWENIYLVLLVLSVFYWLRLVSHVRSLGNAKEV